MPHEALGVEIRELTSNDELEQLTHIYDDVWRPDPSNRPVSTDMLRALSHAGNYVAGAFVGGRLAGGTVAFFGAPAGEVLHSHITGVSRLGRGHQVGYALKQHQRGWAADRGLRTITWTFDPLVSRNAYFNITKLGAQPTHYYRDFYGDIGDELGGLDESDRVLMNWPVAGATSGSDGHRTIGDLLAAGAVLSIDADDAANPHLLDVTVAADSVVLVPVPHDVEAMRRTSPRDASRWRSVVREAMAPLLAGPEPRRVTFLRSGCYVFGAAS